MPGEPSAPTLTPAEILALYQWVDGSCFRCARRSVPTAVVGSIRPSDLPGPHPVRACGACTSLMEGEREHDALRTGRPYVPGPPAVALTA